MTKQKLTLLSVCAFLLSTFVSCGNILTQPTDSTSNSGTVNSGDFTDKVINALVYNCDDHEDSDDYSWNTSSVIPITLNGSSINVTGSGATVSGTKVTVTSTGNYSISGTLSDGQIIVNTEDEGTVRLILNGANITSSTSAPIHIISAKKVVLVLADTTQNYVTDASSYSSSTEEDAPNATIFSMSDLTIFGNGILTVDANYNDGIASKDGLIIKSGTININSVDDGIRGKDYLIVKNGNITVKSGGDGLKSDNEDDSSKGYISIEAGTLNITSGGDAIAAETDVLISNGTISLTSGGGSGYAVGTISTKGIKAIVNTIIDDGTITINSADDALHSNGCLVINGGTFSISSGDDGVHADSILGINGGDILIKKSYEGIESAAIIITDGTIHVTSSDDGINAAGGN
ncbi:MAG: carbohydrate-binding domain-containing protein, partial [Candidatus Marinimicrobia bacterium]|nr:carbohydrate-binding domain-containing protein [Candidatus Neomarinimicrobiota bacterium]